MPIFTKIGWFGTCFGTCFTKKYSHLLLLFLFI